MNNADVAAYARVIRLMVKNPYNSWAIDSEKERLTEILIKAGYKDILKPEWVSRIA
jgi:hypothetical protein